MNGPYLSFRPVASWCVAALLLLAAGCGDPPADSNDNGGDNATANSNDESENTNDESASPDFDRDEFEADLRENLDSVGQRLADGFEYTESAETFDDVLYELDVRPCSTPVNEPWEDVDICSNVPSDDDLRSVDQDVNDDFVPRIFNLANFDRETDEALIYALDGPSTCDESDCADWVDDQQFELEVTSPEEGDYEIAITVGAADATPAVVEVYRDRFGVRLDLAEAATAFESLEPERPMPADVTGEVRLRADVAETPTVTLDVLSAIEVRDGDFELDVAAADEALQMAMDDTDQALETNIDLGSFDLQFVDDSYDPQPGESGETLVGVEVPEARSDIRYADGDPGEITVDGLTFGTDPARLTVDGDVEGELTVNPDEGDEFVGTVEDVPGGVDVRVEPTFDTTLDMKFQRIRRLGVDVHDWMADETLRARFEEATGPTLEYTGELLRVLTGTLTLEAESESDVVVDEDQCLTGGSWDPHPFTTFDVGACN